MTSHNCFNGGHSQLSRGRVERQNPLHAAPM